MGTCGIYKIENKINHKVYIGQSVNIEKRWRDHRYRSQTGDGEAFECALYKEMYGHLTDFDFSILEECPRDMLDIQEIGWIHKYDSTDSWKGYNRSPGGQDEGRQGVYQKLSKEKVLEIIDRLKNTNDSQVKIAKDYFVDQSIISLINNGSYYVERAETFPIRNKHYIAEFNGRFICGTTKSKNPVVFTRCERCGKLHQSSSHICMDCYNSDRHKKIEESVTREELKHLIREISFLQIGKKFCVTDNAIRKWCDYYKLPRRKKDIDGYTDSEWEKI